MRLACYDDPAAKWGRTLADLARSRGHDAFVFGAAHEAEADRVFVRMHNVPRSRDHDRELLATLGEDGRHVTPDARWSRWYDDKVTQARDFARWMPVTLHLDSAQDAHRAVDAGTLALPWVSKSVEGSASHNVRLIRTVDAARREIAQAFGRDGIPTHYHTRQRGYLLWQAFCRGNSHDFRVIRIGAERVILRRGNRPDLPFASGSDTEMPVTWPDAEAQRVLDFSEGLFEAEGLPWCGIDVVFDGGLPMLLEVTVSWPLKQFHRHRFVSGRKGADFWPVVLDEMEAGRLDGAG